MSDGEAPIAKVHKPTKFDVRLPKKARAGRAIGIGMFELLETVRHNAVGLHDAGDPEYLHQLRVSVRGARALKKQLLTIYDKKEVERWSTELAWLARLTNPTRDLDVFAEHFADYSRMVPAQSRMDLEPFEQLMEDRRRSTVKEMLSGLDSKRYRNVMKVWERFAIEADRPLIRRKWPARRIAEVWTWDRFSTTRKRLRRISAASDPSELHRARIELKKLRYLMEFFRTLFPAKQVDRVVAPLKEAQDAFGDLNDLSVHRAMLRTLARRNGPEGALPSDTLIAMGELSGALARRRMRLVKELESHLEPFRSPKSRRRYRELYRP